MYQDTKSETSPLGAAFTQRIERCIGYIQIRERLGTAHDVGFDGASKEINRAASELVFLDFLSIASLATTASAFSIPG